MMKASYSDEGLAILSPSELLQAYLEFIQECHDVLERGTRKNSAVAAASRNGENSDDTGHNLRQSAIKTTEIDPKPRDQKKGEVPQALGTWLRCMHDVQMRFVAEACFKQSWIDDDIEELEASMLWLSSSRARNITRALEQQVWEWMKEVELDLREDRQQATEISHLLGLAAKHEDVLDTALEALHDSAVDANKGPVCTMAVKQQRGTPTAEETL